MSTAHRRSTFETLRQTILAVIPEPEQGLSSGVPILRLAGTPIAGFSAAKTWLSYLPHSGDVIASLTDEELAGFNTSKGSVGTHSGPQPQTGESQLVTMRVSRDRTPRNASPDRGGLALLFATAGVCP